ncbi:hypothetical protein J8273_4241 [Carpediemonas membranifera]|uniref:Uncharacterized protein n=1 Tax=Carpediemonas membranifera TaxID=201153 RepID=A0A8J6B6J9_9EUKA|nr:hypothetical protein J8273_4241 [Carpediemonas membranifera]|eukprot:KAG9394139.1 hypothetical protein J8273_4241 [Carpediemonas membranifera]
MAILDNPDILGDEFSVPSTVLHRSYISPGDPKPNPSTETPNNKPWATPILSGHLLNAFFVSLLIPGIGHLFIGQHQKATVYLLLFWLTASLGLVTVQIFVGIAFFVIAALLYVMIQLDCFLLVRRLRRGLPVCEGECAFLIATLGTGFILPYIPWFSDFPIFVSDSVRAPQAYLRVMRNYKAELGL